MAFGFDELPFRKLRRQLDGQQFYTVTNSVSQLVIRSCGKNGGKILEHNI